jgi:hypothetical protein
MQKLDFAAFLKSEGYNNIRQLEDGTWVATIELMFTRAIVIDLTNTGYGNRFCFSDKELAVKEIEKLVDVNSEPTGYIARR